MSVHVSRSTVSEYLRVECYTVGDICQRVYQELEAASLPAFDMLVNIGTNKTSYKKGHTSM